MERAIFEVYNELNNLPVDVRLNLYTKLGILATSLHKGEYEEVIEKNKGTLEVIGNRIIRKLLLSRYEVKEPSLMGIINKYPKLEDEITENNGRGLFTFSSNNYIDTNEIREALRMFNVDREEIDVTVDNDIDESNFDDNTVNEEDLVKEEDDTDEEVEPAQEISQETLSDIKATVDSIISFYNSFYEPLCKKKVLGVLTRLGCVTFSKSTHEESIDSATANSCRVMMGVISGATRESLFASSVGEGISWELLKRNVTYCPQLCLDILQRKYKQGGIDKYAPTWKEYVVKLQSLLVNQISAVIKALGLSNCETIEEIEELQDALKRLRKLYTTSFVIEKFVPDSQFEMRFNSEDVENTIGNEGIAELLINKSVFRVNSTNIQIMANKSLGGSIHKILLVLNEAKYSGELLFAYKGMEDILAGGGKLGYDSILLGKTLEGDNLTINLKAKEKIVTLIAAGSRSGKGVLTLSLLGTLIASGIPVPYFDYKPDMSATLWDIERKYGVKMLSVDSKTGYSSNSRPIRNGGGFGNNRPSFLDREDLKPVTNGLKFLSYIRGIHLMMALSQALVAGAIEKKSDRVIFIFDEAEVFNNELKAFISEVIEPLLKDLKPKKGEEPSEEYTYINRLNKLLANTSTSGFLNTTGGLSGVGCIIIGQHCEISNWGRPTEAIAGLVSKCQQKILGRQTTNGTVYSLGGASGSIVGEEYANSKTGYFAFVGTNKPQKGDAKLIKVFKSYMCLNENDASENIETVETNSGNCVATLLSNIPEGTTKDDAIKQLYTEDYVPEKRVGFEGMLEFIGKEQGIENIWETAGLGYEVCKQVTDLLGITGAEGKYDTIEDWLNDASMESLFSFQDIEDAINNGYKVIDGNSGDGFDNVSDSYDAYDFPTEVEEKMKQIENIGNINNGIASGIDNSVTSAMNNAGIDYTNKKLSNLDVHTMNEYQSLFEDGLTEDGFDEEDFVDFGAEEEEKEVKLINEETSFDNYTDPSLEVSTYDDESISSPIGSTGRINRINPIKGTKLYRCNDENSILAAMDSYDWAEKLSERFFKTVKGAEYEFSRRWRIVLNSIDKKVGKDLVTRVAIYENNMYINKKEVHMSGIIGGIEDIRILDIVDFRGLFKKFKNIKEIAIDTVILEEAVAQLNNPFLTLFEMGKSLNKVVIIQGAEIQPIIFNRSDINAGDNDNKSSANELIKEARFNRQYETVSASMSSKFDRKSPGEKKRVSESAMNTGGELGSKCLSSFRNKDGHYISRGIASGIGCVALVGIGAIGYLFGAITSGLGKKR